MHVAAGLGLTLAVALTLANTSTTRAARVVGPYYDPERLGVWIAERTPGRCSVVFMLARSRIYEDGPSGPRLVRPTPERSAPAWTTDWSRRIPELQASGTMIDPTQTQEHAFGWPMACLASADYIVRTPGGTVVPVTEHAATHAGVVIPDRVWAPGLAMNTLVLGAPASVAYLGGSLALAVSRRRRGVCAACAYPLDPELAICPECGRGTVDGSAASPARRAA